MIDVALTVLEAAGIPGPTSVNGVTQKPMEGIDVLRGGMAETPVA